LGGSRTRPNQPNTFWLIAELRHATAEIPQSLKEMKARQQWTGERLRLFFNILTMNFYSAVKSFNLKICFGNLVVY